MQFTDSSSAINAQGGTATASSPEGPPAPLTGVAGIVSAANSANFPADWALWIAEGTGLESGIIPKIPALSAAYIANPGATPSQLAQNVLGANPSQVDAINKLYQANETSLGTSTGLMSDIFGDFFEVAYPFVMVGLSLVLFGLFAFMAVKAISKGSE